MISVIKRYPKTPKEIVEAFSQLEESASINESLPGKNGAIHSSIKAVWPEIRMCGVALTVQCAPGDNIMLHKAISMAGPGDVLIVVNGGYDEAGGMFGGMMAASLKARGAAGLVIEGACRDTILIKQIGFPVFASNISIKATTKISPGRINWPLVMGGILINPGDIIYGDNDGVVVVPKEIAASVLSVAQTREKWEAEQLKRILDGEITTFDFFRDNYAALGLKEE